MYLMTLYLLMPMASGRSTLLLLLLPMLVIFGILAGVYLFRRRSKQQATKE